MAEKKYLTRQERARAVDAVMEVLDALDTKDGDREREIIAILEMATKHTLPYCHVKLTVKGF